VSRVQLALNVADLDEAIAFYSKLFATEPAKVRPGYANFAIADPPLKLVLIEDATQTPGSLNHLGVEVDTTEEVAAAQARLTATGLATTVEENTECCYACRTRCGWTVPAGSRGRSTPSWPTSSTRLDSSARPTPVGRVLRHPAGAWPSRSPGRRRPAAEHAPYGGVLSPSCWAARSWPRSWSAPGSPPSSSRPGRRRAGAVRERGGHRGRALRLDLDVRPDLGRALQPGRLVRGRRVRGDALAGRRRLPARPGRRVRRRGGRGQPDVLPAAVTFSTKHRATGAHFLSEVVATLGLLLVIFALARTDRGHHAPAAVGAYIGAAYFFTSSTSFANPAITVGRMFTDTFAGIQPSSAPAIHRRPGRRRPGRRSPSSRCCTRPGRRGIRS
jgi:catechol 2,3-dioxygenase-like lactoylglutathione lyase family enzyme